MDDFVELGIEGADKLVDKHFDKIPDKVLKSETYNLREIRKRRRKRRNQQSSSDSDSDQSQSHFQGPRRNMDSGGPPQFTTPQYSTYSTYVPYSQNPPNMRPEYAPSAPAIGEQPYYPPPPRQLVDRKGGRYEDEDSDDDGYYSDRRSRRDRPGAGSRRSSSYQGSRTNDDYYNDRQLVQSKRRGSHDGSEVSRSREVGHHNFKDEAGKYFTKSPVGITGAVGGALVGGWVTRKAQVARGKGKHHEESNPLITLLGAAAGGLIVNAVIDKFEEGKKETARKEVAWEEKYGSGDESDDSRDGRGRRDRGQSHRRRSRSYSNDRNSR